MFLVSFYIIFFTLKIFAEQKPCKKFFLFQLCVQKTAALANLCAKHQKQRLLFAVRPSFGKALQVFRFRPKFDFWGGGVIRARCVTRSSLPRSSVLEHFFRHPGGYPAERSAQRKQSQGFPAALIALSARRCSLMT